ncbi:MAG TPA: alpha/beta hydrolase [Bacteroidales bacterium]|nr:alpha/beta hydrolase [Bacteroidales bacterium]
MQEYYPVIGGRQLYSQILNGQSAAPGIPWLVFLHEGLGCTLQWRDFPLRLSEACGMPALVYDRWGYGKSERKTGINPPDYMHSEARDFLPELLENMGVQEKIIPVGHSDGGTIALLFASFFPDKTLAVISESDHVIGEAITLQGVRSLTALYGKGKLRQLLAQYYGSKVDDLFHGWTGLWLSQQAGEWSIVERLPAVKAPLLAIQGSTDQYGSVEQLVLKLRHCSGPVQINHLQDCGHIPHHEAPEKVFLLMKDFIMHTLK